MSMMLYADTTPLVEAIASGAEARIIAATLELLGQRNLKAAKIAGRVGIDALWGAADPATLAPLAASGRVTDWMRAIPLGPEPGEEDRRRLASAVPLVQSFIAARKGIAQGMPEPHPELPEPIEPMAIPGGKSVHQAVSDAFEARDITTIRRVLFGLYATGADYRATLEALYIAMRFRYVNGGQPLTWVITGAEIMDMAEWGGKNPAFIYWITSLLTGDAPNSPIGEAARAFAADPAHDLSWMRTRLSIPREEAAGRAYQAALQTSDASAACDATLKALRDGATPLGVTGGMALAVAERVNGVAPGDTAALLESGRVLRYIHAVASAMRHTQHHDVWPLLYTAASAISSLNGAGGAGLVSAPSMPVGGTIGRPLLRSMEQSVITGDASAAVAAARRYMQIENAPRAFAGTVGQAVAQVDVVPDAPAGEAMSLAAAALEEYLALRPALANNGQNALLSAAVRLATELRGQSAIASRVNTAIEDAIRSGVAQN